MIILQLALALFISKIYYDLAVSNNENGWLFGILGIATYFIGGTILGLIAFYIISILKLFPRYIDKTALAIISVTLSLLACWCVYKFLHYLWKNKKISSTSDIIDEELL